MTPDADIDGLVERLRRPSSEQLLGEWQPMREEAAALIEALDAEVARLKKAMIENSATEARVMADALAAQARAEQKLAEIAEIAGNADKRGWNDFDRIAALARSTSTNGG